MIRIFFLFLVAGASVASGLVIQTGGDTGHGLSALAKQFSVAGDDSEHIADRLDRMGTSFENRRLIDSAMTCYKDALELYQRQKRLASAANEYARISALYVIKGMWGPALSNISLAIATAFKSSDNVELEPLYVKKAEALRHNDSPDSAAFYYKQALLLCADDAKCKRSQILFDMGNSYNNDLLPDSAITCWLQAATAFGNENNPEGKGKAFHDCAIYYAKKKSYREALQYFDSTLAAYTVSRFERGIDEVRNNMGTVWYNLAVERFNGGDAAGASAALDEAAKYSFSRQFADQIAKFRDDIRKSR